jgi:hypothetical protein
MLARQVLLPLEPFHQSFFVMRFFQGDIFALGWLPTAILLISAS